MIKHNNCKGAFTLAEVLITLGIIGVVASLTLPSLITNYKTKETVTKLKKVQSTFSQAILMAVNEHGPMETWGIQDATSLPENYTEEDVDNYYNSHNVILDKILPELKVLKKTNKGDEFFKNAYPRFSLDGTEFGTFGNRAILADGTYITAITTLRDCSLDIGLGKSNKACGELFVDINGRKGPNSTGKDVFIFYITTHGLSPMGVAESTAFTFDDYCNLNNKNKLNGYGCAAWVIINENMDYLKCNDLSWNGKTKCK